MYAIIQKEILARQTLKTSAKDVDWDVVDAGGIGYGRGVSGPLPHLRVVDSCAIVRNIEV